MIVFQILASVLLTALSGVFAMSEPAVVSSRSGGATPGARLETLPAPAGRGRSPGFGLVVVAIT